MAAHLDPGGVWTTSVRGVDDSGRQPQRPLGDSPEGQAVMVSFIERTAILGFGEKSEAVS